MIDSIISYHDGMIDSILYSGDFEDAMNHFNKALKIHADYRGENNVGV